mmetsp:Transcript_29363/g.68654  ORF Transcript_29363/g.68654 Transcript_29363/m.68654 type:complete len:425 (+) Transcript_29363:136-1410(+)
MAEVKSALGRILSGCEQRPSHLGQPSSQHTVCAEKQANSEATEWENSWTWQLLVSRDDARGPLLTVRCNSSRRADLRQLRRNLVEEAEIRAILVLSCIVGVKKPTRTWLLVVEGLDFEEGNETGDSEKDQTHREPLRACTQRGTIAHRRRFGLPRFAPPDEGVDDAVRDEPIRAQLLAGDGRDRPVLRSPSLEGGVLVGEAVGGHHRTLEARALERADERVREQLDCRRRRLVDRKRAWPSEGDRNGARTAGRLDHGPKGVRARHGAVLVEPVLLRSPRPQELDNRPFLFSQRVGERRVPPSIEHVDIRFPLVHQALDDVEVPLGAGDVQRAPRVVVALVDVDAVLHQPAHRLFVAAGRRAVQIEHIVRRLVVRLYRSSSSARLQEVHHRKLAREHGVSHWRVPPTIGYRAIGARAVDEELDDL